MAKKGDENDCLSWKTIAPWVGKRESNNLESNIAKRQPTSLNSKNDKKGDRKKENNNKNV